MPIHLRSLTLDKEEAAITRVAYAALAERIDLLSPEGREVLAGLIERVDQIIESIPASSDTFREAQTGVPVSVEVTPRGQRMIDEQAHDPATCVFCANDPEQCHQSLDCEARAWANLFCGPHQPDPKSYR